MPRNYQNYLLIIVAVLSTQWAFGQNDTLPAVSVDPRLLEIFDTKTPKQFNLAGITVTGAKAFDQNLIISISGLAIGDKLTIPGTDIFSKAINKLWKQNLVVDVQVFLTKLEGNDLYIEMAITERPRLSDFKFIGIKKSEKDDLETKVGLSKDRVVTDNMKLSAIDVIQKFFSDKGFRNVKVEVKEKPSPSMLNAVTLVFNITKGNKVKVNTINFANNENITDAKLKKRMKGTKELSRMTLFPTVETSPYGDTSTRPSFKKYMRDMDYLSVTKTKDFIDPYFRFKFFTSSKFNPKKYDEDKISVLDFYNSQGFRDAVIVADTAINTPKGNIDLHLKVNEGKKYFFGNITWRGQTKYSDSILNVLLGIKKGDTYNLEVLNKRLGKIPNSEGGDVQSLYMDDGYLFFRVDPVETAVYKDTIDFEIRMQEGPQATIGKIEISGNEKTKDFVVRRELRTVPGEKFSRADLIRTQRELGQLGFFNPEKTNPNVVPNSDDGTVDITWQVEEKSSDQLELSAGFGGYIGLTGTLGITFNNFSINNIFNKKTWDPLPSGSGQKLSARIQSNGRAYRTYNFSFTEPWLGGKKRNSFSVSLYNTKQSNTYNMYGQYCMTCGDTSFIKIIGASVSLGKQLKWPDDYFSMMYSFTVQQYKLLNYPNIFKGISTGNSTNISLKLSLARNSTQGSPIFPTGGSNFLLSGQFTLPYSKLGMMKPGQNPYKFPEFHKWRFNAEFYVPIGLARGAEKNKQFIIKAAAKYGFIGRYSKDLEVSPFERFQLGDAGLNNTYALLGKDIIAQRGYPIYSTSDPKVNPDNGTPTEFFTIFNKYVLELRYPFSTNPSSTIYGLGFFEAANGWYKFNDYNPFKLRRSAGIGMRFFLPMFGLLGFDYGLGFDRIKEGEPMKGAFKFTFMLGQEPE
jgi:outer membrane protein insertion porin family